MNKKYWDGEYPNLNNVYVRPDMTDLSIRILSAEAFGVFYRLKSQLASRLVHSCYGPDPVTDPGIDLSKNIEWLGVSRRKLDLLPADIEPLFRVRGNTFFIKHWDWIVIEKNSSSRPSLSAATRLAVHARHGHTCVYCGSTDEPLEVDHLFPVAKGGTDDDSNLVCSCKPCNRSKSDKTLKEWVMSK